MYHKFEIKENSKPKLLKIDFNVQEEQIEKLRAMKMKRDNHAVRQSLANLQKVARGSENIMPSILHAVKVYATLGEICDVLRNVFGEYKETVVL